MYNIQNTAKNLLKNGISSSFVEEIADVTDEIRRLIPTGASVAMGGSMSLKECGATELLRGGDYKFLDRDAQNADFFLASSNAVTENGELYNVDGIGNRVGAIACGPKHVILVCGVNKIVPDINAAVRRVKEVAAPPNAKRLGRNTYCAHNGHCAGLSGDMTDGCDCEERICCKYLISAYQRETGRIHVIFVNKTLGY